MPNRLAILLRPQSVAVTVVQCGRCRSKVIVPDSWTGSEVLVKIAHEAGCGNADRLQEAHR